MGVKKTKIVLDADVINHFARGGCLSLLPDILPEFQFIVLDIVKNELPLLILSELNKVIKNNKTISEEAFGATCGEKKEYLRLTATSGLHLGRGESACMVYTFCNLSRKTHPPKFAGNYENHLKRFAGNYEIRHFKFAGN